MPLSCHVHVRDCKALLGTCSSCSHAISSTWPLPLPFTFIYFALFPGYFYALINKTLTFQHITMGVNYNNRILQERNFPRSIRHTKSQNLMSTTTVRYHMKLYLVFFWHSREVTDEFDSWHEPCNGGVPGRANEAIALLIRSRRMALYKCVLIDWLIELQKFSLSQV